jgi:hypothetical protein
MHAYLAQDLRPVGQRLEAGEDIAVSIVPLREALRRARSGELRDSKSIAALLMWGGEP